MMALNPTIGIDNFARSFQLSDGSIINCYIFDTAGQERYHALSESYYRKADAILLVYEISKKDTFEKIKNYYSIEIKNRCKKNIPILLLGNKADLEAKREVSIDEAAKLAEKEDYEFKESSCKKNLNVAGAFEALVEKWNSDNKKNIKNNSNKDNISVKSVKNPKRNMTLDLNDLENIYDNDPIRSSTSYAQSCKPFNLSVKKHKKRKCCK